MWNLSRLWCKAKENKNYVTLYVLLALMFMLHVGARISGDEQSKNTTMICMLLVLTNLTIMEAAEFVVRNLAAEVRRLREGGSSDSTRD